MGGQMIAYLPSILSMITLLVISWRDGHFAFGICIVLAIVILTLIAHFETARWTKL